MSAATHPIGPHRRTCVATPTAMPATAAASRSADGMVRARADTAGISASVVKNHDHPPVPDRIWKLATATNAVTVQP